MKKKIAVFLPSLGGGGAERVMLNIAGGFVASGYEVELILVRAHGELRSFIPSQVKVIDLNVGRVLFSIFPLIKYLRKSRPDAIISAIDANLASIVAVLLARARTKIILTEHSTLSQTLKYTRTLRVKLYPLIMKALYRYADHIIAVSKGVARDLTDILQMPEERVAVIYNPIVNDEMIAKSRQPVLHPWFEQDIPVIISVGRLTEAKDFPTLLRAFAKLRRHMEARLLLLGEGEERSGLEKLVEELGIRADVEMPGFVENPYAYVRCSDLFVLSSKWEGLPTVLVEALVCGVPIISTDCPSGPREILHEGKYGTLVPVGDEQALTAAMQNRLLHPEAICEDEEEKQEYLRSMRIEHVIHTYKKLV